MNGRGESGDDNAALRLTKNLFKGWNYRAL
jgi:hypothetical protein